MNNVDPRISELIRRRDDINRELARNGVRFGIYKNGIYEDRIFPFDPIPRVIPSDEWDSLEAGLIQRVKALNAFLQDIYSDKHIVHDEVIPEEYIYTSAGYYPQVNGVTPPAGIFAHIAGEDLVQGEDGRWWVLEDNLRIPSGASYPLFARDIERRISPHVFRKVRVRDNRTYPTLLRRSMDFVSTEGINVVLTPGRLNSAFFEHAYLAEKTGAMLAFPEDLEVHDAKLYFVDYSGKRHRVGAVYRRLSDEYLDPFAFNPDSVIGVPGLLSAYRAGNVAIINAPGNGVADDKAIYYFVPAMIQYYLHEDPILHNAPTYMPLFAEDRKTVLDRLGELVIKDVAEAGGYGVVFGSSLDKAGREELADRIKAQPRRFIAQEVINFRDIDVINTQTGDVEPRKADLRAFVVTGKETQVWYSGLTRYSSVPGKMIVNSSQGGGFKDTWVLAPPADTASAESESPQKVSVSDRAAASPVPAGREKRSKALRPTGTAWSSIPIIDDMSTHAIDTLTANNANNLYWLGRYSERVFTTLKRFFPFYDQVMDTDFRAFIPFAKALDLGENFQDFDAFIRAFLYDPANPNSVRSAVDALFENATVLRTELGTSTVQYAEMALANIEDASNTKDASDIYKQRDVCDNILAFWGGVENSGACQLFKSLLFMGKYIERIELYTRLGIDNDEIDPALDKLGEYARLMEGEPIPGQYCESLQYLVDVLPDRGYPILTKSVDELLSVLRPKSTPRPEDIPTWKEATSE